MLNHSNRTNTKFVCILQTDAESRMLIQRLYNDPYWTQITVKTFSVKIVKVYT